MHTRQVQRDIEIGQASAVTAQHAETHAPGIGCHRGRTHLRTFAQSISHHGFGELRHDRAHIGVVGAQHGHAIERQALDKIDKGLLQLVQRVVVGLHVVGVDIGDDRQHRLQMKERGIRFVGFGDDELTGTQTGVRAGALQPAADDKGRIQSALGQHAGSETGGCGFAMRASHCDALFQPH